jgi:acetyl-CoA/propionyl-CoA carboxylase biotin carboxyl carrier protein
MRLGAASAAESYLSTERILKAADDAGAQAIHPGYGFLAENPEFAERCRQAGIAFVGPPTHAIKVMGDKIQAKRIVSRAGVPVVPGRTDLDMSDDDLVATANELGYPVLIKPSAGGGGKGMRLVQEAGELEQAVSSARREAQSSFGDDTLFVERYIPSPRHIEFQILADSFGSVVHLGERECSLQRRHQKIIEETPSVLLTAAQRETMGEASVEIGRSVNYRGAGTVEFIMSADAPGDFYFIEMNTRLQVEHPVTEFVTGIDLVEQQLRIAAGEALAFVQQDVGFTGHAVEARIYAEDPYEGFLPTGGDLFCLREPQGEGIRVDSSLVEGGHVGTTYDPMLSKVATWGPDRATALARLDKALAETVVLGFSTNINFLRALLNHHDVLTGRIDTEFVERELPRLPAPVASAEAYVAVALDRLVQRWPAGPVVDRWAVPDGWRLGGTAAPIEWMLKGPDGTPTALRVTGRPEAAAVVIGSEPPLLARMEVMPDGLLLSVENKTERVLLVTDGLITWLWIGGLTFALEELAPERNANETGPVEDVVCSPMPGRVVAMNVSSGDEVEKGDVLAIVEAMKMEYALRAPRAGRISRVLSTIGDQVAVAAPLIQLDPSAVRP